MNNYYVCDRALLSQLSVREYLDVYYFFINDTIIVSTLNLRSSHTPCWRRQILLKNLSGEDLTYAILAGAESCSDNDFTYELLLLLQQDSWIIRA